MKRSLKDVDQVYESVSSFMSKEEKINYCEGLISETESFLNKTTATIDQKTKEKYKILITAAKSEIECLRKKN